MARGKRLKRFNITRNAMATSLKPREMTRYSCFLPTTYCGFFLTRNLKLETRNCILPWPWGSSSVWQSAAFAMRRPGVRSPSAPPIESGTYGEAPLAVFVFRAAMRRPGFVPPLLHLLESNTYGDRSARCYCFRRHNAEARVRPPCSKDDAEGHPRRLFRYPNRSPKNSELVWNIES